MWSFSPISLKTENSDLALKNKIYKKIAKITGKSRCTRRREDLLCYAYDAITRNCLPDLVVFPESASEVSEIIKLANREHFYVIPRGSGTGTTGGSLAVNGGVVIVSTHMNRIRRIDRENFTAFVEPGVITGDFHRAVEKKGMFYPPDPSSSAFCTIGGNVAECAGGPRAVKYGVTRDYVLGLEVVLPTGEIVKTGVETAKGVVGYDLTRLITGSEGTLGFITGITLKLLPLPEKIATMTAVFADIGDAAAAVAEIIRSGIVPRTIEYLDRASLVCAESFSRMGLPVDAGAMLILEADGRGSEVEEASARLYEICRTCGAGTFKTAETREEAAKLWQTRKAVSPALYMYGPHKINEDIVVPRSKIPLMVRKIEELREKTGLAMVSFGHAGDGNIHFNVMVDKKDQRAYGLAKKVIEEVFDYTLALGGTISGEHGIGITKSPYISKEIDGVGIELMKRVKTAFDPNHIFNPGKIFESCKKTSGANPSNWLLSL